MNPLGSTFQIDHWSKILIVVGVLFMLVSLFAKTITINLAGLFSSATGVLCIGLGENINHPLQQRIVPIGVISGNPRNPSTIGTLFDILGFILVSIGAWKIVT